MQARRFLVVFAFGWTVACQSVASGPDEDGVPSDGRGDAKGQIWLAHDNLIAPQDLVVVGSNVYFCDRSRGVWTASTTAATPATALDMGPDAPYEVVSLTANENGIYYIVKQSLDGQVGDTPALVSYAVVRRDPSGSVQSRKVLHQEPPASENFAVRLGALALFPGDPRLFFVRNTPRGGSEHWGQVYSVDQPGMSAPKEEFSNYTATIDHLAVGPNGFLWSQVVATPPNPYASTLQLRGFDGSQTELANRPDGTIWKVRMVENQVFWTVITGNETILGELWKASRDDALGANTFNASKLSDKVRTSNDFVVDHDQDGKTIVYATSREDRAVYRIGDDGVASVVVNQLEDPRSVAISGRNLFVADGADGIDMTGDVFRISLP
jgi:hypothetical protein